jgi:hypothetical protein
MEQIRGTGTSARSDIYALSATLYQLLTNNVPADALTRADSLLNGLEDPVTPIYETNPEVSKSLSDIILKGMAVSQEQRYSTAREMQKALRDAFSRMQSEMAAQTVALNLGESEQVRESVKADAGKEQFATLIDMPVSPKMNSQPPLEKPGFTGEKTEVMDLSGTSSSELGYASEPVYNSKPQTPPPASDALQSGIKTEVLLREDVFPGASETEKPIEREENFSADKTVPFINSDSQPRSSDSADRGSFGDSSFQSENKPEFIPSVPPAYNFSDSEERNFSKPESDKAEDFYGKADRYEKEPVHSQPENRYAAAAAAVSSSAANSMPAPTKKSGNKSFLILGGLFAFFILTIGAGAAGWYAYNNYVAANNPKPTPQTTPSVEATPEITPEATPYATPETNIAAENTNADAADSENANTDSTGAADTSNQSVNTRTPSAVQTPRPVTRPTAAPTVTAPKPSPQVAADKKPKPTPPPKKSPTPRKIEILQ